VEEEEEEALFVYTLITSLHLIFFCAVARILRSACVPELLYLFFFLYDLSYLRQLGHSQSSKLPSRGFAGSYSISDIAREVERLEQVLHFRTQRSFLIVTMMPDPERLDLGKEVGEKAESQDSDLIIGTLEDKLSARNGVSDTEVASEQENETHISFHEVHAVDVAVRDLTIAVSQHKSMSWMGGFLSKKDTNDEETGRVEEIKILDNVSADMPAGELVAIIGGSGSGKVWYN